MRKFVVALAIGLLASAGGLGSLAPQAAAGSPQPKVVIVVGAVEGTTSSYRADADAAATEFLKFTSNVVKVYSPNATWAAVQAAVDGASVLVYLGHGNGYPNPYNKVLYTDRDNGMGLNSAAGQGDSDNKYYGEAYMSQLHLAANADVRFGPDHPRRDLEQNTIATWNVLEAMRATGARRIAFASTSSVYGEPSIVPTPEDAPFPVQTSLYGAAKVAAEGMINAYVTAFGFQAYIFRFGPVMGERCTHGSVVDFYRQLIAHPERLDLPADGRQWESCLYVQDLIDAILLAAELCTLALNVFNLGPDEDCQVPSIGADGGPCLLLDCARMRSLGWKPRLAIAEGVNRTLEFLRENPRLLEARR